MYKTLKASEPALIPLHGEKKDEAGNLKTRRCKKAGKNHKVESDLDKVYEFTYSSLTLLHVPLLVRLSSRYEETRQHQARERVQRYRRRLSDESASTTVKGEDLCASNKAIHFAHLRPVNRMGFTLFADYEDRRHMITT